MPKGPKGQKRPADVIGNAVKIAQIATGEIDEDEDAAGESVRPDQQEKVVVIRNITSSQDSDRKPD